MSATMETFAPKEVVMSRFSDDEFVPDDDVDDYDNLDEYDELPTMMTMTMTTMISRTQARTRSTSS